MKNVLLLVKNEYIKLFSTKKIYLILSYILIITFLSAHSYNNFTSDYTRLNKFPPNMKSLLLDLNLVGFLKIFSTDSIFGGTTQFTLMFISLLAIDTFLYDFKSGNAKFILITGITKMQLILSKYIYMLINIIGIICLFFIAGNIFGLFFFKTSGILIKELYKTFLMYLLGSIPMIAFTSIIAIISTTNINKSILTVVSIMIIIIIGISDSLSITKFFSPTGMLGLFNSDVPLKITRDILKCSIVSFAYFIVSSLSYFAIINKKDIF